MSCGLEKPFGQPACEAEVNNETSDFGKLYFDETPFNDSALEPHTYLIIGRRGSGKTALAQSFSFQKKIPNTIYIAVDKPESYRKVLAEVANSALSSALIAIPQMCQVWDYVLWSFISRALPPTTSKEMKSSRQISQLINSVLSGSIVGGFLGDHHSAGTSLDIRLRSILAGVDLESAKARAIRVAKESPIIITLDTLEQYDVTDKGLMNALAALIEFAGNFNLHYSDKGIHLKVLMSGEVMPHLADEVLSNTIKYIRDPVYLFWRPKDLLRLISWRLFCFLDAKRLLRQESKGPIDWTDHREVLERMWIPYFGDHLRNSRGIVEQTFPYVLRHTQMRPRQLIVLCNSIADQSIRAGRFPVFSEEDIREGVRSAEKILAGEIINSFRSLYPRVGGIVSALQNMPKVFLGNELDRRAKESASEWPPGTYSQSTFRALVTELGIVGKVRRDNTEAGFIDADFEYSVPDKLTIRHSDKCVIHPMFYEKLAIEMNSESRVMPFSTDRESDGSRNHYV